MTYPTRRMFPAVAACCAALTVLVTACQGPKPGPPHTSTTSPTASHQSERSIFKKKSVIVGVKKGQPGFNTLSGVEYENAGFEKDLVEFLADELDFKASLRTMPSLKREEMLTDEEVDLVVATYTISDSRDKTIDFTAPYFKTYQGVLVREGDDRIKKRTDLEGMRVCSAYGSTSDPGSETDKAAQKDIKEALGDIKPGFRNDYKACVKELEKGNFDAVWTDKVILEGFAASGSYDVEVVKDITIENRQFYGIGIREGHEQDCRALNKALNRFLTTRWRTVFQSHFAELAKKEGDDFEQVYRPSDVDFTNYDASSCGG
ncbi:transporter substrate-binding domain-containing protein [Streptomyces sp. NPDC001661]